MAIVSRTYAADTGLDGNSPAVTFPAGFGGIQIDSASSLVSTIEFSLDGGDTWTVEKDATSITADGTYAVEQNCDCLVRVAVTSGSCDYIIKAGKRF